MVSGVWRSFKRWLLGLLLNDVRAADITDADLAELRNAAYGPPAQGWFVWECEQYQKYPAFWFDPFRYHGTPFAYPDPTERERKIVFEASLASAVARHGARVVAKAESWAEQSKASEIYDPDSNYAHQPDPVEYAMREYLAVN